MEKDVNLAKNYIEEINSARKFARKSMLERLPQKEAKALEDFERGRSEIAPPSANKRFGSKAKSMQKSEPLVPGQLEAIVRDALFTYTQSLKDQVGAKSDDLQESISSQAPEPVN